MTRRKPKVICIGWHKTGTSTLGDALIALGYTVVGARLDLEASLRDGDPSIAIELAKQFDAVQDIPWAPLFKELDRSIPGAKFIFTDRDDQSWIQSAIGHFKGNYFSMHELIYGVGVCRGNEQTYLSRYRQHRSEVLGWFSNRQDDLLIMNLNEGDGWIELCNFLDVPVPNSPWPHSNKGRHSLNRREKAWTVLRRLVPLGVRRKIFDIRLQIRSARGLPDPRDKFNNIGKNRRDNRGS